MTKALATLGSSRKVAAFAGATKFNSTQVLKAAATLTDKTIEAIYSLPVAASDETARPRFEGELHAILLLPNGKNGIANYVGPGTRIIERLKRNDPPRTPVDAVAMAHDIRYTLAKNVDDIKRADEKMIDEISRVSDAPRNIFLAKNFIQLQMKVENAGILAGDAFSTKNFEQPSEEDAKILREALDKYEKNILPDIKQEKKEIKEEIKEIKEEKEEEKEFLINLITEETSMPMETEMEEEEEEIIENRSLFLNPPPVPRTYTVKKIQLERDTSSNGIPIEIMMKTRLTNASAELR